MRLKQVSLFLVYCKKNVELNNCKNVRAIFGAVADKDNEVHFYPEIDFQRFQTYGSYGLKPNNPSGCPVKFED